MAIAHFGSFNAECLAVDTFAFGALAIDDLVEGTARCQCHAVTRFQSSFIRYDPIEGTARSVTSNADSAETGFH